MRSSVYITPGMTMVFLLLKGLCSGWMPSKQPTFKILPFDFWHFAGFSTVLLLGSKLNTPSARLRPSGIWDCRDLGGSQPTTTQVCANKKRLPFPSACSYQHGKELPYRPSEFREPLGKFLQCFLGNAALNTVPHSNGECPTKLEAQR